MPAGLVHSATVAHSAILTDLTESSAIGFIASGLVLATFGMKDSTFASSPFAAT